MRPFILLLLLAAGGVQADLYVVAHRSSPIEQITPEILRDAWLARVAELPEGLQIRPVDREEAELRQRFLQSVVGMSHVRFDAYWARLVFAGRVLPPLKVAGEEELVRRLSQNPIAVGYTDRPPPKALKVLLRLREEALSL